MSEENKDIDKTEIISTDWNNIRPTIWHCNAFDDRLYLFVSPSGKTHIAKWVGDVNPEFMYRNYEFTTLCNRTFTEYTREEKSEDRKLTGWHRPSPFYHLLHNPDPVGFLGVTCPRCAKLEPKFREPKIEIDRRPHSSAICEDDSLWHYDRDAWNDKIIPQVLFDPERRCETCDRTCTNEELEWRRKEVIEWWHQGYRPRACKNWQAGVYSKRQNALGLTDEQLKSLPKIRLQMIYDHLITTAWEHETDMSFQIRVVKALKLTSKER